MSSLAPLNTPSEEVVADKTQPLPPLNALGEPFETETYVWTESTGELETKLWSFEDFMRDSAWKWVGPSVHREDYEEVERRRAMNGVIERAAERAVEEGALN